MKKLIFINMIVFIFIILFYCKGAVKAINVKQSGDTVYYNGYDGLALKYYDSTAVFCTQFKKNTPAGNTCEISSKQWDKRIAAGIATIIKNVNLGNIDADEDIDAPKKYYYGELAINRFLYENEIDKGNTYVSTTRNTKEILGEYYYLYEDALKAYADVNKIIKNFSISIGDVSVYEFSDSFYLSAKIDCKYCEEYRDLKIDGMEGIGTSISGNTIAMTVPKSILSEGDNNLTISVVGFNKKKVARNYSCGTSYQTVTPNITEEVEIATKTATKKVTLKKDSKGKLTIIKKDSETGELLEGVGFTLFSKNCYGDIARDEQKTDEKGEIPFKDLTPGTYYISETSPLDNYSVKNRCFPVTINAGDTITETIYNTPKNRTLTIIKKNSNNVGIQGLDSNTTTKFQLYEDNECRLQPVGREIEIDASGNKSIDNLTPRIYYLKEIESKQGYALPDNNCIEVDLREENQNITIENKTECEQKFNADMSMKDRIDLYNDIYINSDGKLEFNGLLNMGNTTAKAACKHIDVNKSYSTDCLSATGSSTDSKTFRSDNVSMYTEKFGKYTFCLTTFKMQKNLKKPDFGIVKSGQAIISGSDAVATATLTRTCYNYAAEFLNKDPLVFEYNDYVKSKSVKLGTDGILNESVGDPTTETLPIDDSIFGKTTTIIADYYLPEMYASNKDGRVYYGYGSCPKGDICKNIGNGIISQLNHTPSGNTNEKLEFNLELNNFGDDPESSKHCTYSIENELIDKGNNIDLEFRTVKTNSYSAFLNKSGTGEREPGSNWAAKDVRDQVLVTNNDSYNKNKTQPLYEITLTPSDIKKIRSENKNKGYDDYNFECKNGGKDCISKYLTCLKNDKILEINDLTRKRTNFKETKCVR